MRKFLLFAFSFLALGPHILFGQVLPSENEEHEAQKVTPKIQVKAGEKFDLLFTRGLLMRSGMSDSVDITPSRSGSYSLGFGLNFPFAKGKIAYKMEPRAAWNKLYFPQTAQKFFPTAADSSVLVEKLRSFYVEIGTGFRFNLVKNDDEQTRFFLELGVFGGYNLGNVYKAKYQTTDVFNGAKSSVITIKQNRVFGFDPFRYGGYARVGTNYLSLYLALRASDIFLDLPGYPAFSPLETGFTVSF